MFYRHSDKAAFGLESWLKSSINPDLKKFLCGALQIIILFILGAKIYIIC